MYIINLNYGTEKPEVCMWGSKYNVPLNIREEEVTDEEGNTVTNYICDLVEHVTTLSVEGIVSTAAKAKFGDGIAEYVASHLYDTTNTKVTEYTEFVQTISEQAKALGYE